MNKKNLSSESEYDNFIKESNKPPKKSTLEDFVGEKKKDDATTSDKWEHHWMGMPDFTNETDLPFKKLIVTFKTAEDYQKFIDLMDQPMTEKTKTIWFPELPRTANSLKRWMEE